MGSKHNISKTGNRFAKVVSLTDKDLAAYLTAGQAAKQLGISVPTLWRWTVRGFLVENQRIRLKSFRFGRALRIKGEDVLAFAETLARANAEARTASVA